MADYTQITNFTIKDSLPSGDPEKIILGSDFDAEFAAIEAAIASKVDTTSDTGALQVPTGDTAARPPVPAEGMFRFNSENQSFEGYDGTSWTGVGGASGGGGNPFIYENDITVTVNYTITASKNGMSAGPLTIADGIAVTVPTGSTWTIV